MSWPASACHASFDPTERQADGTIPQRPRVAYVSVAVFVLPALLAGRNPIHHERHPVPGPRLLEQDDDGPVRDAGRHLGHRRARSLDLRGCPPQRPDHEENPTLSRLTTGADLGILNHVTITQASAV